MDNLQSLIETSETRNSKDLRDKAQVHAQEAAEIENRQNSHRIQSCMLITSLCFGQVNQMIYRDPYNYWCGEIINSRLYLHAKYFLGVESPP